LNSRLIAGRCRLWLPAAGLVCALVLVGGATLAQMSAATASASAAVPVNVFPIPGGKVAAPQTQLTFRGIPASEIGDITVAGSSSGVHTGKIEADSDGHGGSFLPTKPFTAGETVTVATHLDIVGGAQGVYRFTIARPLRPIRLASPAFAPRTPNDARGFHSSPNLHPVAITVDKNSDHTAPGYIFLAPQAGPIQNGPMIVDSHGNLVWFKPVPRNDVVTDFRVQEYDGKPVLTWWQGSWNAGTGRGVDEIYNTNYQPVATVRAANGVDADLHEFTITSANTALVTSYYPVRWNASQVHGSKNAIVFDCVVQEIDIPTGLVLFQWDSLDHVPVTDSETAPPKDPGHPYNYFHVNSVQQTGGGNLIISARNTWAAYEVNHETGAVMWTLGGKASSFKFGNGASFAFQHDVHVQGKNDTELTTFDDGAGPPDVHSSSRGLTLRLNPGRKTATEIVQDQHAPPLLAIQEGDDEQLSNGDSFVGWGQQPYMSEFSASGQEIFDARLAGYNSTYRIYRFTWEGFPKTNPSFAVTRNSEGQYTAWASWNGATEVKSWRILGGSSPKSLRTLTTISRSNFESSAHVPYERYYETVALNWRHQVMETSAVVRPK
jgi:hypothetical protein